MNTDAIIDPKEEAQKLPVTVKAPIVPDIYDLSEYVAFIAALEAHSNVEVAKAESVRLTPYFNAMSNYLKKVPLQYDEHTPRIELFHRGPEGEIEADPLLESLITPESLHDIFNAMAVKTRNTITSDVAILPLDILGLRSFRKATGFSSNYSYGGYAYNFGFLQVFENGRNPSFKWIRKMLGSKNIQSSSVTFPIFLIDSKIINFVKACGQKDLFEHFQTIMTFVNHDALHHYTTPVIARHTAYPYINKSRMKIRDWSNEESKRGNDYETWAHIGQEKILLDPDNAHLVEEIIPTLDKYFKGLKELGAAMMLSDYSAKAHEVVDYLGMLMMQAVTRVFPLNHPITQGCLDLLEWADPAPSRAIEDCFESLKFDDVYREIFLRSAPATMQAFMYVMVDNRHEKAREVIAAYAAQDFDIYPDNGKANYAHYKMLQLVAMGGLEAHTPGLLSLKKQQNDIGHITLSMLKAAAETAGYKPKS